MKKLLIVLCLFCFSFTTAHKYYFALTEIEYNQKNQSLEIIMSVFIDDIEEAINKNFNIDAKIWSDKEIKNIDTYFKNYLNTHFEVSVNNQIQKINYLGKEYNGDIVYFYLEIEGVQSVETIKAKNNMLMQYFPEQQNIIKAKVNSEIKSLFLTKDEYQDSLEF